MTCEAVGFDLVRVNRFNNFAQYSPRVLQRVFTHDEIVYCLGSSCFSAQRFAVRFAAKEAFYKALCSLHREHSVSFFSVCRFFSVEREPFFCAFVDWERLGVGPFRVLVSVSHESDVAGAVVFLRSV